MVLQSHGNVSYSVRLEGGRVRKCHVDQLREAVPSPDNSIQSTLPEDAEVISSQVDAQPTEDQAPFEQTNPLQSSPQAEQSEQSEQTLEQPERMSNEQS